MKIKYIIFLILSVSVFAEASKANEKIEFQEDHVILISSEQSFWQRIETKKPSNQNILTKDLLGVVQCVNDCFEYFGDTVQARNCADLCHVLWY